MIVYVDTEWFGEKGSYHTSLCLIDGVLHDWDSLIVNGAMGLSYSGHRSLENVSLEPDYYTFPLEFFLCEELMR